MNRVYEEACGEEINIRIVVCHISLLTYIDLFLSGLFAPSRHSRCPTSYSRTSNFHSASTSSWALQPLNSPRTQHPHHLLRLSSPKSVSRTSFWTYKKRPQDMSKMLLLINTKTNHVQNDIFSAVDQIFQSRLHAFPYTKKCQCVPS